MLNGLFEPTHLILIAAAALLLVGPKRLPGLGRKVGGWLGEFRNATTGLTEELKSGLSDTPRATTLETTIVDAPAPGPGTDTK